MAVDGAHIYWTHFTDSEPGIGRASLFGANLEPTFIGSLSPAGVAVDAKGPHFPETTITSGPAGGTKNASPSFRFRSNEPGSTFQCRRDSAAFSACSSPKRYRALPDGRHKFEVRAVLGATGVDTKRPSSKAFAPAATRRSPFVVTYLDFDRAPSSGLSAVELWARRPGQTGYSKVATDSTPNATRAFSYDPSGGAGTYRFFTRARDRAGNHEARPARRDAATVFHSG
jgi:hypothetical protein